MMKEEFLVQAIERSQSIARSCHASRRIQKIIENEKSDGIHEARYLIYREEEREMPSQVGRSKQAWAQPSPEQKKEWVRNRGKAGAMSKAQARKDARPEAWWRNWVDVLGYASPKQR
jgi:hypothetical protein